MCILYMKFTIVYKTYTMLIILELQQKIKQRNTDEIYKCKIRNIFSALALCAKNNFEELIDLLNKKLYSICPRQLEI